MTSLGTGPAARPSSRDAAPTHALGRTLLVWLAVVVSLQVRTIGPPLLIPTVLASGLLVNVVWICTPHRWRRTRNAVASTRTPTLVLVVGGLVLACFEEVRFALPGRPVAGLAVIVGLTLLGTASFLPFRARSGRYSSALFLAFVAGASLLGVGVLHGAPSPGDVGIAGHDSLVALLHGHDPYAITIRNPYEPARTHLFFNPEVVIGNRLDFGYAYLPASLLAGIPGFLLGNVGYSYVAALACLALLLRRMAVDTEGRALALVPLAMPFTPQLLVNQWVEPIAMLLLGTCAWAMARRRQMTLAGGLGLLLASKQYFLVVLPLLAIPARRWRRATVWALVVAATLCGVFALWDPHAFWHSTVWLQFHLPLREDSVSLPVAWSRTFGSPSSAVFGPLALIAGFVVSTLVALRGGGTTTAFTAGVGLSLLATVLLSEHAFANYYALIETALVIGAITWAQDEADQPHVPDHRLATAEVGRRGLGGP